MNSRNPPVIRFRVFRRLALAVLAAVVSGVAAQEGAAPADLGQRLAEVQDLQSRQKYVDALLKLDEIEAAFPATADLYNLRGAILLAPGIRDFEKAEVAFKKAAELQKGGLGPAFNLAELAFVRHDWANAKASFEALLKEFPKMQVSIRHLVLFKILICQLRLGEMEAAEAALKTHFTFMDDTPAYYFSKAAIAFQKEDNITAQEWLAKAVTIFGEKHNAAYIDCLKEVRWMAHVGLPLTQDDP